MPVAANSAHRAVGKPPRSRITDEREKKYIVYKCLLTLVFGGFEPEKFKLYVRNNAEVDATGGISCPVGVQRLHGLKHTLRVSIYTNSVGIISVCLHKRFLRT